MSNKPLVIERTLDAPVEAVWEAITDNEKMKQWYFNIPSFNPVEGFEFSFTAGNEAKEYVHHCKITAVVPNRKLSYTWKYDGYPGESEVTWELFPEGDKTKLVLTHSGLHTFDSTNDPAFGVKSFTEGWNHITGKSLVEYLAKNK